MERLKRCGRYHKSPIAPKQLRNDLASQSFVTPDKILFIEQLHTDSIDLSTSKLDSNNPIPMTNESENVKLNNANYPCISFEETAERIDVTSELSVSGENCVVKKVMVGTPSISFAKRTHDKISTDSPVSGACKQSRHLGLNRTPVNQNRKTFLPKFQQKLFETPDSAQKYADALPSTPNSSPSTPDSVHQTDTDASIEKVGLDGVADLMVDEKLGFAETGNPVISEFKRKPRADNCCSQISGTLRNRHATLTAVLATKTDVLRKLNLVKMYRSKVRLICKLFIIENHL